MHRITALVPSRSRWRAQEVDLFVDGEFRARLLALSAAHLAEGQELTEQELEELLRADAANRAQEQALRLLEHRPRARAELEGRLRRAGFTAEAIATALNRLERVGLVDDMAFARYWVEQRAAFRPRGKRALRHELRRQGVRSEVVAAVLREVDETVLAAQVAKAQRRREGEDELSFRHRILGILQRRGFGYDAIRAALEAIAGAEGSEGG